MYLVDKSMLCNAETDSVTALLCGVTNSESYHALKRPSKHVTNVQLYKRRSAQDFNAKFMINSTSKDNCSSVDSSGTLFFSALT